MRVQIGVPPIRLTLDEGLEDQPLIVNPGDDAVALEVNRTLESPLVEIVVFGVGPNAAPRLFFAVGERLAVAVFHTPPKRAELAAVTRDSIPAIIADTIPLGPGPLNAPASLRISNKDFAALARDEPVVSGRLARSAMGPTLASGDWSVWGIQVAKPEQDGEVSATRLDIIGARGHGWWILENKRTQFHAEAARAAEIWALLSLLV